MRGCFLAMPGKAQAMMASRVRSAILRVAGRKRMREAICQPCRARLKERDEIPRSVVSRHRGPADGPVRRGGETGPDAQAQPVASPDASVWLEAEGQSQGG